MAESKILRILCSKKSLLSSSTGVKWLIGSPLFLSDLTVISSFRCIHYLSDDPFSPDVQKEADDIRALLLRGFDIVGALVIGNGNWEEYAGKAIEASCQLRKILFDDNRNYSMIGSAANTDSGDIQFGFGVAKSKMDVITNVVYEDTPQYLWETGCLLRCELAFKLPVYLPVDKTSDTEKVFSSLAAAAAAKLRDPHVAFLVEGPHTNSEEASPSIVLHGAELDFNGISDRTFLKPNIQETNIKTLACSSFFLEDKNTLSSADRENAGAIQVSVLSNQSRATSESGAPIAQYFPASEAAKLLSFSLKLDVLCYGSKNLPVTTALSTLIVPGLGDQIMSMKKAILSKLSTQHPQLRPFHFLPAGFSHPITAIYDLRYGETEVAQGDFRKSLHARLGLPMDRPLLRIANALTFGLSVTKSDRRTSSLLKDVHTDIPASGVSGGSISLVDGSYEYYHYLHDGVDDNGWGCAYRSLQTIISWFRLQQYSSSKVPSHREIQKALVEIGDKDPAFIGSREWIGAIELSFVLDKLLGVSCKIMNVRSGAELPEKCRELAMHFETQGTPVMIGGGVLAYTLLGVDYNEVSGDCAFLILDPHYTGSDDLKKIVNGGWCGWKKSVDSKGRNFFLKDKFYNLLLPQRPNMV